MLCYLFSPLWGAGQDAVIALIMTHVATEVQGDEGACSRFHDFKAAAHMASSVSRFVSFCGDSLPASKSLATDLHTHAGIPSLSCPQTQPPLSINSDHSCVPGPVPGVGECRAGEDMSRVGRVSALKGSRCCRREDVFTGTGTDGMR